MKRVIVESPLAGDVFLNMVYARRCMRDSLMRGEAPFASHLLYAQDGILDDDITEERMLGINAGLAWGELSDYVCVYVDLGISTGMRLGIQFAESLGKTIEYRKINPVPQIVNRPSESDDLA